MKKKKLYIAQVPMVSHEFARALDHRFTAMEVRPGVTQEDLLYNAGQRSVVEFIKRQASGTTISGDVEDLRPDERNESLLARILGSKRDDR